MNILSSETSLISIQLDGDNTNQKLLAEKLYIQVEGV
jgi:hypothetical protein